MTEPSEESKRATRPSWMFSLRVTFNRSISSWRSETASSPLAATRRARSSTSSTKSVDLATKSVSHRSSTMAAALPTVSTATAPCVLSRSERLAELARPFSRSHWAAASASPSFSSRARLASIIPAPVAWRSACTSLAVKVAIYCSSGAPADASGVAVSTGVSGALCPGADSAPPSAAGASRVAARRAARCWASAAAWRRASRWRSARRASSSGSGGAGGGGPPSGAHHPAFLDRVGDHPAHESARADGVVVARDHVLDQIGVAVGVHHGDDRHAELVGLGDRDVLLLGVDDEDSVGQARHVADAAEVALQLLQLAREDQRLLLRHGLEVPRGPHPLVLLHLLHPAADGGEVGEHAAEPALVDIWHAAALGVSGDRVLGLLLGADEQDRASVGHQVTDEGVGDLDPPQGLVEVDDVDAVALAEDEPLHLRVPAPGLVAEVDPGLQQLLHGHDSHGLSPIGWSRPGRRAPRGDRG